MTMHRAELVADYKAKLAQDAATDNWTASDAAWRALSAYDQTAYSETFAEAILDAARNGELTESAAREWLEGADLEKALSLIGAQEKER